MSLQWWGGLLLSWRDIYFPFTRIRVIFSWPAETRTPEMANHSSILAGTISWTEEPGRLLQSVRLQRVGRNWACLSFSQQTDWFCMNVSKASWKSKKPFSSSQDDGCNMDDQAQGRNWDTGYLALDSCWAAMLPVAPQVYRVRFEGKPLLEQVSIFLQGPGRGL